MSKSEIQSWLSSASMSDDGESSGDRPSWQRDRVLNDWQNSMEYAQNVLLRDKAKARVQFLQDELLSLAKHGDLTLSQILDVFKLLTLTYPRYSDGASRDAVEAVGMELVRRDELRGSLEGAQDENKLGVTEQILGWLSNEVSHFAKHASSSSFAPSDLFVLLSWSCGVYTICLKINPEFPSTQIWRVLVGILATLLDMLDGSIKAKPSLKHGALVRIRRALRSASDQLSPLITTLLSLSKSSPTPVRFFPLLGVAVSVLLRLKHVEVAPHARLSEDLKNEIVNAYSSNVIMSKTAVSTHVQTAFHDFISSFVTADNLTNTLLPTMEKVLLRSPELALPTVVDFFAAYPHPLDSGVISRLITQIVNCAKSSNPLVRTNSIHLFKFITIRVNSDDLLSTSVSELLSLPKTGKSAGPDHRVALYSMLSFLAPSFSVSASLVEAITPLLAKETHEAAVAVLAAALPPHLVFLLKLDMPISAGTTTLIVKEMNNSKPGVRRAFASLAGRVFFEADVDFSTGTASEFAKVLLPAFENSLKTVAGNPLNASGGPLEGYIAVAVLLGPLSRTGKFDDIISKHSGVAAIVSSTTRPSFLLWDKVYQRTTDSEDERWLLRACETALLYFKTDFMKNEALRSQLGLALLHLVLEGSTPEIRRATQTAVAESTARDPLLTISVIRDAVNTFLSRGPPASKVAASVDEPAKPWNRHARLSALLLSAVSFDTDLDLATREDMITELIIIGHHSLVCSTSGQTWIDLCQKAGTDPCDLTNRHLDKLFNLILGASTVDPKYGFADASSSAVGTLAFVSPATVLPRIVDQLWADINPSVVNALTETDIGIWLAPEGTTYVDVLASVKGDAQTTKGKDYEIAKWEAELRKSLASKKASGTTTLTKQQHALVNTQLEKEAKIRQHVTGIKWNLERGLQFVRSLVASGVEEFRSYISPVASLLLEGALGRGSILVGRSAFDTYLELAKCSSDRLDTLRSWVGIATLRSLKADAVPEELQAEPLKLLIVRVLYRLRFLSEQAPFDVATFSYAYPLLGLVLSRGGIAVDEVDEALEQVALALGIIKFHCGEFSNSAFPRLQTIENLLHTIRQQPKLSKEASSALVEIGEAICASVSSSELSALLSGTLMQEVYVRNSCLQALQPFDLTDLDWSPELLIACHDEDEQNARLARHLWEDNGLDIPETFLDHFLEYLGHDNAYVRSSLADAIAEGVEHWPQVIGQTVHVLQRYYRDKAKLLAPEFDDYGMLRAETIDRADPWPARLATASTFEKLSPLFSSTEVVPFFRFLIQDEALGDRVPDVRRGMLNAGTSVIDLHDAKHLAALISVFEEHLGQPSSATAADDHIKEAVVILFGRVARHLDPADPRIPGIIDRLVEALKTPAEQVQIAVSDCLSPLVKLMRPRLPQLVDNLFDSLLNSSKYAIRRGAAYGLAGVLKGTGIAGMKEFNIISRLRTATEDKKRYEPRQGVMFAFETLSNTLGRPFEPYITYVLPLLLASFGDALADVREATQDAARVIMANRLQACTTPGLR